MIEGERRLSPTELAKEAEQRGARNRDAAYGTSLAQGREKYELARLTKEAEQ